MSKRWLARFPWSVLLILVLAGGVVLAQPAVEGKDPLAGDAQAAAAAPPRRYVSIWTDNLENRNPAVAYNSRHGEFLVVWENQDGATVSIHARRVRLDRSLGSEFTVISTAAAKNWLPAVAYSPREDEYLVVYTYQATPDDYDLWARRISWDGSWISTEFAINTEMGKQWYPAVAYNSRDNEYLVVYENYWANQLRDIAAQRVRAADSSLASWRNIASAPNTIRRLPDVAYNAARNEYLIAYTYQSAPLGDGDIRAKITNANMGTLSSEMDITVPGSPAQDGVDLAAGMNEYMAVWGEDHGATTASVWGRRVGPMGGLQPFITLAHDTGKRRVEPAAGYGDQGQYLISWRYLAGTSPEWDLYGRTVHQGQNSPAEPEFPLDTTSNWQGAPATDCAPMGPCLIAYEDGWPSGADFDISGQLLGLYRVVLPVVHRH